MATLCQPMGRWGVVCINQHYPWKGRAAIHSERTSAHMGALVKALVTVLNLFPYRIQNELTWWGWPLLLAQKQVQGPVLDDLPHSTPLISLVLPFYVFTIWTRSLHLRIYTFTPATEACLSSCCRTIYLWQVLLPPTQMVSLGPRCEWLGRPRSLISFSDDS